MNPQFDHKFLEQYLANKMSPVEKMAFEARLNSDNVLKAELEAMKRMRSKPSSPVVKESDLLENEFHETRQRNYWPYLLIALFSFMALLYLTLR